MIKDGEDDYRLQMANLKNLGSTFQDVPISEISLYW